MSTLDSDLALHCLEDLGGRKCPIVKQRADAMKPDVCEGLSIRDQLFAFCVQACKQAMKRQRKGKKPVEESGLWGQANAFAYSVALIDNPYRPDYEGVLNAAKMEAR